ncbi:hypothetical protein [Paenibacillus puerhi]|uniref:hypothetical protein n=1 Tax=Paenibacillus puerhi TaxID=2692622 RepID=UPI001356B230|nr:hypothetical protein [Paenibacillus puerhi]
MAIYLSLRIPPFWRLPLRDPALQKSSINFPMVLRPCWDPMADSELFKRFAELSSGKITFLFSHRLGCCKLADHILVPKNGELIEQGTYDSLMKRQGGYCRMYMMQA